MVNPEKPVIATKISDGVEFRFDSVSETSNTLFGRHFNSTKFISQACRSGEPFRGYTFRYENEDDYFTNPNSEKLGDYGTGKRPVFRICNDSDRVLSIHDSITEAAVNFLDFNPNSSIKTISKVISNCCHYPNRKTAYGFRWEFISELPEPNEEGL